MTREEVNFENVIKAMIDNDGKQTRKIAALTVMILFLILKKKINTNMLFSLLQKYPWIKV